jgi:hypothetical protein
MSPRVGRDSRRFLFAPHVSDLARLRQCPICEWVIDQDHAEAMTMHATQDPEPPNPLSGRPRERYEYVPFPVTSSALV